MINYICSGRLGNILFGICHLLETFKKVNLLGTFDYNTNKILNMLFDDKLSISPYNGEFIYNEDKGNPHKGIKGTYKENDTIHGYFQIMPSLDIIEEIRNRVEKHIGKNEYIVIHVRRGDFMSPQNTVKHSTMCKYYYKKAMSYFPKDSKFMVVSDDIEWCKENIKAENITYSNGDMYTDFCLLLGAKGIIYGNSTFGYFGALLNPTKDKLVIACKNWYKLKYNEWNKSYKTVFPDNYPDNIKLINYIYA